MLAPSALLARRALAAGHPRLPPPFAPAAAAPAGALGMARGGRGAVAGGADAHVRPAITRRLREGPAPAFPPEPRGRAAARRLGVRPAGPGGGRRACTALARGPQPGAGAARSSGRSRAAPAAHRGGLALASGAGGAGMNRALTVGLLMMVTISAFQALGVGTVLPAAARELDGLDAYGWAFSATMLASVAGNVAAGQAADGRGPVRPFLAGSAVFTAGCVVAAAAGDWPVMLAGRGARGRRPGGDRLAQPTSPSRARIRPSSTAACWRSPRPRGCCRRLTRAAAGRRDRPGAQLARGVRALPAAGAAGDRADAAVPAPDGARRAGWRGRRRGWDRRQR